MAWPVRGFGLLFREAGLARLARVVVPGVPHLVTQRGNRRETVFFGEGDYAAYRGMLAEAVTRAGAESLGCLLCGLKALDNLIRTVSMIVAAVGLSACADQVVTSQPILSPSDTSGLSESGGARYALPKTYIEVAASWDASTSTTSYKITAKTVADPMARYVVHYRRDLFTDDDFALKVDTDGLLTGDATSIATSEHGQILVALAQAAGQAAALVAQAAAVYPHTQKPVNPPPACTPTRSSSVPFTVDIDPSLMVTPFSLPDSTQIQIADPHIAGLFKPSLPAATPSSTTENASSLYYRSIIALPLKLTLAPSYCPTQGLDEVLSGVVDPSPADVGSVDLLRLPFTKRQDTYSFVSGSLSAASVNSPSQALGFVQILTDMITAIGKAAGSPLSNLSGSSTSNSNTTNVGAAGK